MKKVSLTILLLLTCLTSCVFYNKTETSSEEVRLVKTTGSPVSVVESSMPSPAIKAFMIREYLFADKDMPDDTFSLIVFHKKPVGKEEFDRYVYLCEEWKALYTEYTPGIKLPLDTKVVPFYWMLAKRKHDYTCENLVQNYDYERAQLYALSEELDSTKSYLVFQLNNSLVTMDITKIKSEEELSLAMSVWKNKMRVIPKEETSLTIYTIGYSAKLLLGALGNLIAMK